MSQRKKANTDKAHFNCHIKVLRTDLPNSSPSVMLLLEHARYTFNCGESMQRLLCENRIRLSQEDEYCFTSVTTHTMAGLPGLIMGTPVAESLALQHQSPIVIIGPVGIGKYLDAFKTYAAQHPVVVREQGASAAAGAILEPIVATKSLTIRPVLLLASQPPPGEAPPASPPQASADTQQQLPSGGGEGGEEQGQGGAAERAAKRQRRCDEADARKADPPKLPVLCYLCEMADRPGKFDPKKAASLGVARGPLYGELQRGRAVAATTGRVVHPHEVMDPVAMPGPVVAVVDCPSLDYLPALSGSAAWDPWTERQQETAPAPTPGTGSGPPPAARQLLMMHMSPWAVVSCAGYQEWMRKLGGGCQHVVADHPGMRRGTMLRKSAIFQAKLNMLDPTFFPLGPFLTLGCTPPGPMDPVPLPPPVPSPSSPNDPTPTSTPSSAPPSTLSPLHAIMAGNMLKYHIYPPKIAGPDTSEMPGALDLGVEVADFREKNAELMVEISKMLAGGASVGEGEGPAAAGGEGAGVNGSAGSISSSSSSSRPELMDRLSREELEVTFLGTASAIPANYRNVSGTWVDFFHRGALMVDCGEDSFGQLIRRFGQAEAEAKVRKLQCVWVSHMHADHHGGLYPLMVLRQQLLGPGAPPLLVIGPTPLFRTLSLYTKVVPLSYAFVANDYVAGNHTRPPPANCLARLEAVTAALQLKALTTFPVQHIRHSFGLSLEGGAGWKVVFSGDTRPCKQVVEAARGALLLVHEATFEDELQAEAEAKMHSTFSEAIQVAAQAEVYRVIMTHFSQRYPKLPAMSEKLTGREAVAFDLMSVNLADLDRLPLLLKPLELLLAEESASMEAEVEDGAVPAAAAAGCCVDV